MCGKVLPLREVGYEKSQAISPETLRRSPGKKYALPERQSYSAHLAAEPQPPLHIKTHEFCFIRSMISVVEAPSMNGRLITRPPAASTSSRP
jgi:hypothetical protein